MPLDASAGDMYISFSETVAYASPSARLSSSASIVNGNCTACAVSPARLHSSRSRQSCPSIIAVSPPGVTLLTLHSPLAKSGVCSTVVHRVISPLTLHSPLAKSGSVPAGRAVSASKSVSLWPINASVQVHMHSCFISHSAPSMLFSMGRGDVS